MIEMLTATERRTAPLHAEARRVGHDDVEVLVLMAGLAEDTDVAIAKAVQGLPPMATPGPRSAPGSASAASQAAQQRWGAAS